MSWYLDVLRKYAVFEGRSRRQEFWMFVLINVIIEIILSIVFRGSLRFIPSLYSLAVLLPSLAVGARRLHDIGRTGWWQLLALIPVVGIIILIIWWATEGHPGANQYGPNPKTVTA